MDFSISNHSKEECDYALICVWPYLDQSPTVDDMIHSLNGATVFSKLDLRSGYHQVCLAPESRYITTFATHKGLRKYKRLKFWN